MLRLADTSIKMFRKKDGNLSLRLRSYLMVPTDVSFRLSTYLRSLSGRLEFPCGKVIDLDSLSFTDNCSYALGNMIHGFWATAIADPSIRKHKAAKLTIEYHLSFTGHSTEEKQEFSMVVPLIDRTYVRSQKSMMLTRRTTT